MTPALHLRLTSDPAEIAPARKAVEAFAAANGLNTQDVHDIGLCVNEAIANIIRHAYAGQNDRPIELIGTADAAKVEVVLRDWGDGRIPDLKKPHDPLRPGGLGLPCLKMLLDGLAFEPRSDGMCLRLTKLKR